METILFNLLFFLTLFFVATQMVMLVIFIKSQQKHKSDHLGDPALWGDAKKKSDHVIGEAIEKANEIMEVAEKKGVDILAAEEKKGTTLATDYRMHFEQVEEELKKQFDEAAKRSADSYGEFLSEMEHKVDEHIDNNQKVLLSRADDLIQHAQTALEKMSGDVDKRVKDEVEHALDEARAEITEYKKRRMKVVDERIIDMLEDVIKVTLEKKLSLVEQSELVYKALDEAKRENAFN